MKHKSLALALTLVFGLSLLLHLPITSALAQSTELEAQRKELARAKEIVQRLRGGKLPSREELDILSNLLARFEKAVRSEGPSQGDDESAPPKARGLSSQPPPTGGLFEHSTKDGPVYMYVVDMDSNVLRAFWRDRSGKPYGSITRLREIQSRDGYGLQFAINGGIFDQRLRPQGLYIEQGKVLSELDTSRPGANAGNFYLEPNGVFFVDSQGNARILTTQRFSEQASSKSQASLQLAVQSGPVLLIDGKMNPLFPEDSANKKRRSGVAVLDHRRVVFGMSAEDISFYDFAAAFARVGCRDALYLDGGEIGALYSRKDRLGVRTDSSLVTIFGVIEKLAER